MEENKSVVSAALNQIQSDRHSLLLSRLSVAKAWCKKPHEVMKRWIAEYEIDNFDDTSEIRDKVRIGYIFRKTENENASIFDDQPDLFIKGKTAEFADVENIYSSTYDLLWDKQRLEEKIEDVGVYFELLGMGFISSPYEVKTKKVPEMIDQPVIDEMGQPILDEMGNQVTQQVQTVYEVPIYDMPKAEVENPFKLFFSPETVFGYTLNSENCPYYFKEKTWSKDKVKALFNKDVTASEKLHTNDDNADLTIDDSMEGKTDVITDDLKRVSVYEYYGTLPENMAKDIKDKDGNAVEWSYDREYHIYLTKNEELQAEECPYSQYPLFVVGNYGMMHKFWKFGDAKHLLPLVQELETYRSQILAHTRKMVNPKPLVDNATEIDEDAFRDPRVGKIVKYSGNKPEYLAPPNLGSEVGVGVEQARIDLEKTSPSFDLNGGGGQSQVRSPRGIATFSEAADKGSRRKRKKIARLIRELIIFQFMQCGMNWAPDGTKSLEIGGKVEQVTPEVLQALTDPDILAKVDVEIESLSVNRVQMREEAMTLWDIASSAPNVFNVMEVARDLVQNGFNKRDGDRYLVSMDQMNSQAIQGFLQQLSQQNPELANAVMQYVNQPNAMDMQDNAPDDLEPPTPPPALTQPPGSMPPMGEV